MGIPKFFRYVSERYPLVSQSVEDNKIPEFDCLYLDMNGIIHNCSHTEDEHGIRKVNEIKMFENIFKYIDHLFNTIKPKQTFFMAVDGVAPRAKMNQQRSRRFRTAKERQESLNKAEMQGADIKDSFDSNCITPGTLFMAKLSNQLKYFVNDKITNDAQWRNVNVILSGHEVPGEGEHKIQEFIRLNKTQDDYNPNTRHCLYGLDADLIMLGLLSHEPHFCLLREEVTFGKKPEKKQSLEHQKFYLLHLSLFREYLDLEFDDMKSTLNFKYDLERIIDDFILLAIFVGNDFLPNLPGLHINDGAFELLFLSYKKILQDSDGYINELGKINLKRLQLVINHLHDFERTSYKEKFKDDELANSQIQNISPFKLLENQTVMTTKQAKLHKTLTQSIKLGELTNKSPLILNLPLCESEREYLHSISDKLNLNIEYDHFSEIGQPKVYITLNSAKPSKGGQSFASRINSVLGDEELEDEDEELDVSNKEDNGVTNDNKHYDEDFIKALYSFEPKEIIEDPEDIYEVNENTLDERFENNFNEWKSDYYSTKLHFNRQRQPEEVKKIVHKYIEGIQWVIKYYYEGCASWGWFYNYHYAPKISDIVDIDSFEFSFEKGTPFRPFEQLMGVLPSASKELVPSVYRELMTDEKSPIINFYPVEFETDMNEKKQSWEAVVLIPFIEENLLLKTLKTVENSLTPEEKLRNSFGKATKFYFDETKEEFFKSFDKHFPDITKNKCVMEDYDLPSIGPQDFRQGLVPKAQSGINSLAGFPTLYHVQFDSLIQKHGVKVFNQPSKRDSIVLVVSNLFENHQTKDIAKRLIGKRAFINWPFLQEVLVVGISDQNSKFEKNLSTNIIEQIQSDPNFDDIGDKIEKEYSEKCAVRIGSVDVLIHGLPLKGLKQNLSGDLVKNYEGIENKVDYPLQTTILEVVNEDRRFLEQSAPPIKDQYPINSECFFLGNIYGSPAVVTDVDNDHNTLSLRLPIVHNANEKSKFNAIGVKAKELRYYGSPQVARILRIKPLTLARITSSLKVLDPQTNNYYNLGLNMKYENKGEKVLGYSQKNNIGWEFSDKAVELISAYKEKYPELFNIINNINDIRTADQIWNDKVQATEKLVEIKGWLKEMKVDQLETVSLFVNQLNKSDIGRVEELSDQLNNFKKQQKPKFGIVKGVPRHAVLKPSHASNRIINQQFKLCDRVIYISDSGYVKKGSLGTVVGVSSTNLIDIVLDEPCIGGNDLGGKCKPYRGATVASFTVINLSNEQFKASMDGIEENKTFNKRPPPQTRTIGPRPAFGERYMNTHHQQHHQHQQIFGKPRSSRSYINDNQSFSNTITSTRPPKLRPQQQFDNKLKPTSHQQNLRDTLVVNSGISANFSKNPRPRPPPPQISEVDRLFQQHHIAPHQSLQNNVDHDRNNQSFNNNYNNSYRNRGGFNRGRGYHNNRGRGSYHRGNYQQN